MLVQQAEEQAIIGPPVIFRGGLDLLQHYQELGEQWEKKNIIHLAVTTEIRYL